MLHCMLKNGGYVQWKEYEGCLVPISLWCPRAREPFFNRGGVKFKNQVLSCNVMRWFSPQPLTSCWLLIQRKGLGWGATWMQMINAFVKTQHKSAICNFWPAPNFRGKGGQLTPLTWPSRALVGVSIVNREKIRLPYPCLRQRTRPFEQSYGHVARQLS